MLPADYGRTLCSPVTRARQLNFPAFRRFGQVCRPSLRAPAVASEIGPRLAAESWLVPASPRSIDARVRRVGLGIGESHAISLALERGARLLVLDEEPARRLAKCLGVPTTGTAGLLIEARALGVIPAVRPLLDALVGSGFYVSASLCTDVLSLAGEDP